MCVEPLHYMMLVEVCLILLCDYLQYEQFLKYGELNLASR